LHLQTAIAMALRSVHCTWCCAWSHCYELLNQKRTAGSHKRYCNNMIMLEQARSQWPIDAKCTVSHNSFTGIFNPFLLRLAFSSRHDNLAPH